MDETLYKHFLELDARLRKLAQSDSSIEYSPHIREEFDEVIYSLNMIKAYVSGNKLLYMPEAYFK